MFEGIERITFSNDWITVVIMLVLTLISILKLKYSERFTKLFSLLSSETSYPDSFQTNPLLFNKFHLLFCFVIIFNISLIIFNSFKAFQPDRFSHNFSFFMQINLVVVAYLFLRYLLGYIIAFLFDVLAMQKYVTFLKISNLSLISVLYFPLLILINYTVGPIHKFLITLSIVAVILLFFLRYFVLIKKEKINFNNLFYLILYLCALEIAPFIVVYKTFVD